MRPFTQRGWDRKWYNINANGIDVPNSDYIIKKHYNQMTLTRKDHLEPILRVAIDNTSWCCGVAQAGAFYEHREALNVPDEVLNYFFKTLVSLSRHTNRKGVFQGWFYRCKGYKDFQHGTILKMFKQNGMKKIGRPTYNPNSGNYIQGYQASIKMRGID